MRASPLRLACVLLVFQLVVALSPATTRAEPSTPTPVSNATTWPPASSGEQQSFNGVALGATADQKAVGTVVATTDGQPQAAPALLDTAIAPAASGTTLVQGSVTLDVSTPTTIRPGEYITYTYAYKNTSSAPISGAIMEARWANFGTSPTVVSNIWQYCPAAPDAPAGCVVLPGSVQGPAVQPASTCPPRGDIPGTRFCFSIGQLGPGQVGRFQIRLRSNRADYPRTGQPPTRPSGSGLLYLGGSNSTTSEDTSNTLVVGPVIVLTKTTNTSLKIYTGETAEFVLRLGNATGAGDVQNSQVRADARPATNLILKDTLPIGGEFISATGSSHVDAAARTVTWIVAGPLKPGQTVEFHVVFRKADVKLDCTRLMNQSYSVSYDDPDRADGAARYTVVGLGIGVTVVVPLVVKSITPVPASIPFGAEATLTIVVQNFWNLPLSGVQLRYDIQSNASYIPASAAPAPSAAPTGTQLGGRLTWTFSPAAGTKTAPTATTYSFRVRAGYTSLVQASTGHASITVPNVPTACSQLDGKVRVDPRLYVVKVTDADPVTWIGDAFSVVRGQQFAYRIEVTNSGPGDATGVSVGDAIPAEPGANFSYVPGSATLNGQSRAPNSYVNGPGGSLIWNNLTVPAHGTIRLDYRLRVDGRDYWKYCNTVSASRAGETINYDSSHRRVCVKINPRIDIAKVILLPDGTTTDRSCADPGHDVRFKLTLTNHESTTYRVGLYDLLGDSASRTFAFVRQESGYAQPQADTDLGSALVWPLVDLAPNKSVSATIVARIPADATPGDYVNEGLFHNAIDVIHRIPKLVVKVHTPCIEYAQSSDRTTVSLEDRLIYTLQIKNDDVRESRILTAVDLLPQGFSYVGLDATSDIRTTPQQPKPGTDGRVKLVWSIPAIAPLATVQIKFIAKSGGVVGAYENWFTVPSGGTCVMSTLPNVKGCKAGTDGTKYAFQVVNVQPLITMEPKINVTTCVLPGTLLTYHLSIVNTNVHDYTGTIVVVTLPFGLQYMRPLNMTPGPMVTTNSSGVSTVTWSNLRIPAKPANASTSQVVLEVQLRAGQVWGNHVTVVSTTSADGMIPRKDGVLDPTVRVCSTSRAIAIEAYPRDVRLGDEVLYQITLANPTSTAATVTVTDQLPVGFTFLKSVFGPAPSRSGNTLTWSGLKVLAAANDNAGIASLKFKVRLASGVAGTSYANTARVTSSPVVFTTAYSSVSVKAVPLVIGRLINPGFELAANNVNPDGWTPANATRSNAVRRHGSYAMLHYASNNASYIISQVVPNVVAGTAYNFSGWVNIPATSDTFTFSIRVQWRNSLNKAIGTSVIKTYTGSTGGVWDETAASLVAPAETTNALVSMQVQYLNARIYVDDLAFWP